MSRYQTTIATSLQLPSLDYQRTALHLLPRAQQNTKSVVHVALELLSMLELLAKHLQRSLYVYVALFKKPMYLTTITKHPSIHIPILNPKAFMVINSEIKVGSHCCQSRTI